MFNQHEKHTTYGIKCQKNTKITLENLKFYDNIGAGLNRPIIITRGVV